jgi:hypothetical protein
MLKRQGRRRKFCGAFSISPINAIPSFIRELLSAAFLGTPEQTAE